MSYDVEFQATKLIRQGKAALEPLLADLAGWIASRWQVAVLNVIYDEVQVAHKRRPRLQVMVEHSCERQVFFDGHSFDPLKQQAVAARFVELVNRQKSTRFSADSLLVVFSAFAPLAREDADNRIRDGEVHALQERIANPTILRFVEGRCIERWSLVDSLSLLTQIGALGAGHTANLATRRLLFAPVWLGPARPVSPGRSSPGSLCGRPFRRPRASGQLSCSRPIRLK